MPLTSPKSPIEAICVSTQTVAVLYHDKVKQPSRIKAAYHWSRDHACPTNVSIQCSHTWQVKRSVTTCTLRVNNHSCDKKPTLLHKTPYILCQSRTVREIRANANLSGFCIGQRDHYTIDHL